MDTSEDVVFSILLWLPVSVLLRFKVVCKSWRSLIESSDFITQHLHHQHHHDHHHDHNTWDLITLDEKLICYPKKYSDDFLDDVKFTILSGNNFQLSRNLGFTFRFQSPIHFPKIISSCHGIICLDLDWEYIDGHYPDIALWNPATRQFRTLPEPPVLIPIPNNDDYFLTYGLSFDDKTNDYKVVRILIYNGSDWPWVAPEKTTTDVYSLSTNSWKTVENAVVPVEAIYQNPYVPFQNGIYCWLGQSYLRDEAVTCWDLIFSYHFSSEEFRTIPVPDIFVRGCERWFELSFLNEKISCLVQENPLRFPTDIWVLNQYGVADSWTKLYSVTVASMFTPIGFSKNGKIFWRGTIPDQGEVGKTLNLFDPVTHELNILAAENRSFHLQVAPYKESLVSINSAGGASAIESDIYVDFF